MDNKTKKRRKTTRKARKTRENNYKTVAEQIFPIWWNEHKSELEPDEKYVTLYGKVESDSTKGEDRIQKGKPNPGIIITNYGKVFSTKSGKVEREVLDSVKKGKETYYIVSASNTSLQRAIWFSFAYDAIDRGDYESMPKVFVWNNFWWKQNKRKDKKTLKDLYEAKTEKKEGFIATYETHHIDLNRQNNVLSNLELIQEIVKDKTIEEWQDKGFKIVMNFHSMLHSDLNALAKSLNKEGLLTAESYGLFEMFKDMSNDNPDLGVVDGSIYYKDHRIWPPVVASIDKNGKPYNDLQSGDVLYTDKLGDKKTELLNDIVNTYEMQRSAILATGRTLKEAWIDIRNVQVDDYWFKVERIGESIEVVEQQAH